MPHGHPIQPESERHWYARHKEAEKKLQKEDNDGTMLERLPKDPALNKVGHPDHAAAVKRLNNYNAAQYPGAEEDNAT